MRSVGFPKVPIKPEARPKDAMKEIDGTGIWVLPGFVDMHGHSGGEEQGTTAEYVFKLWMAHGITSVREPGCGNGVDWCLHERDRSARNEIVAPRLLPYVFTERRAWDGGAIDTPEQARKFVQWVAKKGADGIKILGAGDPVFDPEILSALHRRSEQTPPRHRRRISRRWAWRAPTSSTPRAWVCAGWSTGTASPRRSSRIGRFRTIRRTTTTTMNSDRFGQAGRLWKQAAPPGSEKWNAVDRRAGAS